MDSTSLISPDNTWMLWMFLTGWAAISIYLEQRFKWASTISGAVIALVGAMVLTNLNIIPTESEVYDVVWDYVVPLAIPLLLFQGNLRKILKQSGRILMIFLISSLGTVIGAILAFSLLGKIIDHLDIVTAMMSGSYTGGSVNLAAMASKFNASGQLVSTTTVADNMLMAVFFIMLIAIPSSNYFQKRFRTPYIDELEADTTAGDQEEEGKTQAASFWGRTEMSLKDIATTIALAFALVTISFGLADLIDAGLSNVASSNVFIDVLKATLGDQYLMLTTLTVIVVTSFPNFFEKVNGSTEIGTFLIYLFFVVIGAPASLVVILQNGPMLFVFVLIIALTNLLITLLVGRTFKFSLEEMVLASNANLGGPTTAAAMAIAKGWNKLIVPILLVGVLGYVFGNYIGTAMYYLVNWLF